MNIYIVESNTKPDYYYLITEDGEILNECHSTMREYAYGDLFENKPKIKDGIRERFKGSRVDYISDFQHIKKNRLIDFINKKEQKDATNKRKYDINH